MGSVETPLTPRAGSFSNAPLGVGSPVDSAGMRTLAAILLSSTILAAPATAGAGPTPGGPRVEAARNCGTMYGGIYRNITARAVSCWEARQVMKAWQRLVGTGRYNGMARGMYCRKTKTGYESANVRCATRGGRLVRWQIGT